jgi:UDP-glucuronate decarboxylase
MARWITDRLGTSPWNGCAQSTDVALVDVRELRDASGNPAPVIREKIAAAVAHLNSGRKVLVCCDHGVSRSNAIAAGVLTSLEGKSYDEAIAEVIAATGESQIKLDFVMDVRSAIGEPLRPDTRGGCLVIGAEGFLGRALSRVLGAEAVSMPSTGAETLMGNPVLLDAGLGGRSPSHMLFCWHPPQLDTNAAVGILLSGLRNVLEVCRLRRIGIVFVSGYQVFAARHDDALRLCAENEPLEPSGAAGDAFYLAEQLVGLYASRHGLEALIVRPAQLYGAGDERPSFLNTFVRKALAGVVIQTHRFSNGAPCVDVLHVGDFARGVALAIGRRVTGTLHLASGEHRATDELAREIVRIAGSVSTVQVIDLPGPCTRTMLDAGYARRALGWSPEIALADGLREVLSHFKINAAKGKEDPQHDR